MMARTTGMLEQSLPTTARIRRLRTTKKSCSSRSTSPGIPGDPLILKRLYVIFFSFHSRSLLSDTLQNGNPSNLYLSGIVGIESTSDDIGKGSYKCVFLSLLNL